jgi:phospholipid/cholesterol/gamma-HCH transport system substrate-binding protein
MTTSWATQRWQRLRTVPGLGRDAAAVTVMIILGVLAALIIRGNLATGPLPWQSATTVKAEFDSVPGVNVDSSAIVTTAGVEIGRIADWEATDRGTAILTLQIDGEYPVYDNARAVLRPKNPLNEMSVELNPGAPPGEPMAEGDVIPVAQTQRPIQADEVLDDLDARSQQALTDLLLESDVALAQSSATLPGGLEATSSTVRTLQPVMDRLSERRSLIARLVTSLSTMITAVGENDDRVATLATATHETLETLAASDEQMRASLDQLPGLTTQLKSALTSTQQLTAQLDPTLISLDQAATTLPGALKRFGSTVGNLDKTLDAAQPVLAKARPVIADLRPLVVGADQALDRLLGVTTNLDRDTQTVMSYLTDIKAFVYNTSSVFGAGDAHGSIIRGHLIVPLPGAGVLPNENVQDGGQ